MSKANKDFSEHHFDTRTRQRYLNKGVISQKDYQTYLMNLPNDEENFELAPFEDEDLDLDNADLDTLDDEAAKES